MEYQADLIAGIAKLHCTPGWIARSTPLMWPTPRPRRHASHALCVMLDARGAYSVVNGKRQASWQTTTGTTT